MGLETGNYISALVKTNPLSSDNVSEGDDHLQLIKKVLKQTFPAGTDNEGPDQAAQVIVAKATAPTVDTSASGHAARAMGLVWLDTTNNLLKIRNQANDAWITLAVDPETSNSVDIDAGSIDGTPIGATTASTGKFSSVNVAGDGATVTGIKDEDDMASALELAWSGTVCPPEFISLINPDCPLAIAVNVRVKLPEGVQIKFCPASILNEPSLSVTAVALCEPVHAASAVL